MKTYLFPILAVLALLVSCGGGGYNPPEIPNNDGEDEIFATADFSYELSHPFYVTFENKSKNATNYKWDFGDGTTSTEENPTHKYPGKGVYKVTLRASGNGSETISKNITVLEPTKCYITGIVFNEVPKDNEFYSARLTDDYILLETLYWKTSWKLLSHANIPYEYIFKDKYKLDLSKSEYVLRLYQNSNTSGNGTQINSWKISSGIIHYSFAEEKVCTSKNVMITMHLAWE